MVRFDQEARIAALPGQDEQPRCELVAAIDLAADPSVGGMVSCNTGGTRLLVIGPSASGKSTLTGVLVERLVETGREQRTAILCAERLPWQCHRYLVADSLVARGHPVLHLVNPGHRMEHALSRLVRKDGDRLVYDAGKQLALGV